ncbi:hypothetical protein BDN72DRAFT_100482 [Pluteus cervinus]|uniref:Uncharacterized protein n=1 Tax=Pluteus cervinus TaxID=181527 RepID=A0ACD3B8D7_9AGAR|nr:hypothetical protein BDN72DRAFT_100482 [Pluteus cervinus]
MFNSFAGLSFSGLLRQRCWLVAFEVAIEVYFQVVCEGAYPHSYLRFPSSASGFTLGLDCRRPANRQYMLRAPHNSEVEALKQRTARNRSAFTVCNAISTKASRQISHPPKGCSKILRPVIHVLPSPLYPPIYHSNTHQKPNVPQWRFTSPYKPYVAKFKQPRAIRSLLFS